MGLVSATQTHSWLNGTRRYLLPSASVRHIQVEFPPRASPRCKAFPGDQDWPSDNQWQRFNQSLSGALLKPSPPGAVCYPNHPSFNPAACSFLLNNASATSFHFDNPISVSNIWPQGNTCPILANPQGTCTQGGFPTYVVNATTVKHVQLAVNFARCWRPRWGCQSGSLLRWHCSTKGYKRRR